MLYRVSAAFSSLHAHSSALQLKYEEELAAVREREEAELEALRQKDEEAEAKLVSAVLLFFLLLALFCLFLTHDSRFDFFFVLLANHSSSVRCTATPCELAASAFAKSARWCMSDCATRRTKLMPSSPKRPSKRKRNDANWRKARPTWTGAALFWFLPPVIVGTYPDV